MTPSDQYNTRLASSTLTDDPAQRAMLVKLDALQIAFQVSRRRIGWLGRLVGHKAAGPPRGLYIHGEVGRGKTMLMDIFYDSIEGLPKRRIHFHAFMQEVHAKRTALRSDDVISTIADDLAREAKLLCLDEMQIVDIADAMIIGRLFEALDSRGICLVTTSNVPPEELYKDGLNRELFLPFIARLRARLDVIALDSATDYRLGRVRTRETFLNPATAANRIAFNSIWNDLTDSDAGHPETLDILGRKLLVPKAAHGCAAFTFNELCREALGPADYLALAINYRTIFVSGIAALTADQRNEARRFILMIDTFYDARTRLVALADCPPESIAPKGKHGFEFRRTLSRLKEMQSANWWA